MNIHTEQLELACANVGAALKLLVTTYPADDIDLWARWQRGTLTFTAFMRERDGEGLSAKVTEGSTPMEAARRLLEQVPVETRIPALVRLKEIKRLEEQLQKLRGEIDPMVLAVAETRSNEGLAV